MEQNEWVKKHNEMVVKHNKRVTSIRETRLPKSCVDAIDNTMNVLDQVHESLIDGVCHGYHPLTLDDVVRLTTALQKLKAEFNLREMR
jgi:hypothetical protein